MGSQTPQAGQSEARRFDCLLRSFHLLISTAVKHWKIEDQRSMHTTDPGLKAVVRTFADLQQKRHRADYDNGKAWTRIEVAAQ